MSLKHQKEQFVSGLTGGSIDEIYAVTGLSLAGLVAHTIVQKCLEPYAPVLSVFPVLLIVPFYFDVMVQLQAITIYSGLVWKLYYVALAVSLGAVVFKCMIVARQRYSPRKSGSNEKISVHSSVGATDSWPVIPYITAYRSQMIIITNLAILAVDFHVFPRRFAKVETWGTSLMDLGVGLFVFSMGLANSRSVLRRNLSGVLNKNGQSEKTQKEKRQKDKGQKETGSSKNPKKALHLLPYLRLVASNTLKALPVLFLGVVRLVSVKSLEYQEHVTEYGVHWNFFMTLGLLPVFMGVLDPVFSVVPRFLVALVIGFVYEYVLSCGLARFVLDEANRATNLVTLNKEGLASFVGYLSIFIFGQSFGSFVLAPKKMPNNLLGLGLFKKQHSWLTVSSTLGLVVSSIVLWGLFYLVKESSFAGTISRRLANLSYILWVVSYNSVMLLCYNLTERWVGSVNSRILNAINKNGLAIFLAANLATGLVNMCMNTLAASDGLAYSILTLYAVFWVALALILDHYKIYIKL